MDREQQSDRWLLCVRRRCRRAERAAGLRGAGFEEAEGAPVAVEVEDPAAVAAAEEEAAEGAADGVADGEAAADADSPATLVDVAADDAPADSCLTSAGDGCFGGAAAAATGAGIASSSSLSSSSSPLTSCPRAGAMTCDRCMECCGSSSSSSSLSSPATARPRANDICGVAECEIGVCLSEEGDCRAE